LRADVAGDETLGNLLWSDAHHSGGNESVGPKERDYDGDDQPGKSGPNDPGTIAPQNIDIVLDIGRATGNTDISLLGYHKSGTLFLRIGGWPGPLYASHGTIIWSPGFSRIF
jgi:hypothetical protein